MNSAFTTLLKHCSKPVLLAAATLVMVTAPTNSQSVVSLLAPWTNTFDSAHYTQTPITTVETAPPQVMLNMTRDHQLFYKAYNDYSDLDNDGAPETTYKHAINYYGYFDSGKCYLYSTANSRFEPDTVTADKYCNAGSTTGQWSGNFLNWVSMTRMDAVRKLLYGGNRSTDSSTATVLERAPLPTDAHSFAKYYNGSDIAQLAPFTTITTTAPSTTSSTSFSMGTGSRQFFLTRANLGNARAGDQIRIVRTSNTALVMRGYVTASASDSVTVEVYSSEGSGANITDWTLTNLSTSGISFCNTTWAATDQQSHTLSTSTYPPLLRVARGNFELWGANERWQCYWREERTGTGIFDAARNGNQAFFSGLNASNANPNKANHALGSGSNAGGANTATGEYYVRVQACVTGKIGTERCKQYPSGNSKPIGLLQVYGDDDRIRFGLMTSSYERNVSGGVLRKNISSFTDEVEEPTTGVFSTAPSTGSIVAIMNRLRMWGYEYNNGTYIGTDRENCDYQLVGIAAAGTTVAAREVSEGRCASWGNPVGEVYLESLRYLGAQSATTAFDSTVRVNTGDSASKDATLSLGKQTFADPMTATNYCSSLNVLTFTASVSSYDNDQMNGLSSLRGSPNANTYTDTIGTQENIHGSNWFVGNIPTNRNQLCTGKTISSLAAIDGICPEASAIEGAFLIGGAALYARTNRIRNDFSATQPPASDNSSLKITSYGIELATNTPNITLTQPVTGRKVSIQPVYRLDRSSNGTGPFGSGAIVDFRIVSQDTVNGKGRFYVNWEDSTQGGDYDQDMYGIIEYEFLSGDRIKITVDAVSASTANGQGFGYIISGTTQDGPHFHAGILNYDYLNESSTNPIEVRDPLNRVLNNTAYAEYGNRIFVNTSGGCRDCVVNDPPTSVTYTLGAAAAGNLKSPLYYMSKYGGFVDSNNNSLPDLQSEWDSRDRNGNPGTDGVPDTYFLVSNPTALESSLRAALDAIIAKTASGTAAAVVSNAQEGQGAVYQALYESSRTDANGRNVKWFGALQAVFIDRDGRLREDGDGDKILDEADFGADPAFDLFYDTTDRTTKLRRYAGDPASSSFALLPLNNLRTLWNSRQRLSDLTNAQVVAQRTYSGSAADGRHILTWVDSDQDGVVDSGETVNFTQSDFGGDTGTSTDRWGVLNVKSYADAGNLVSYVRGQDAIGLRSRTLDYDGNGSTETMRLGDIVQSTPTPVGRPSEGYNLLYGDKSYNEFALRWAQRRNVIYAGANDGMLHAFNGGFYNATAKKFELKRSTEIEHPLGSELWAYVPYNLLPHLRWLTENNYKHQYYIDGKPKVFDARVFSPETACGTAGSSTPTNSGCIHPNGWGTVLVVPMRFGGGQADLPAKTALLANAGFGGYTNLPSTLTTRSAYVVLDVTNPEAAPTVMAEITSPLVGYTTSQPTVWFKSSRDNCIYNVSGSANRCNGVASRSSSDVITAANAEEWYLVFGNGPLNDSPDGGRTGASAATTTKTASLYVWNLKTKTLANTVSLGEANSFVSDPTSIDWNINYRTDNLYAGTIGGTAAAPTGKLKKIDTGTVSTTGSGASAVTTFVEATPSSWQSPQTLMDPGSPVISAPSVTLDELDNRWVYAGTGRFYVNAASPNNDKLSSAAQKMFGVVDRKPTASATAPTCPQLENSNYDTALPRDFSSLLNTTSAVVKRDGTVSGVTALTTTELPDCAIPSATTTALRTAERDNNYENELIRSARLKKGWKIELATGSPSERVVSRTTLFGEILFATPFTPSATLCEGEGSSKLFGVFYKTGTPRAAIPTFGTISNATESLLDDQVIRSVSLGQGLAAGVALHLDASSSIATSRLTAISQTSTAALTTTRATVGAGARSGEIDWRDSRIDR